jgi:type VI secretion system secreted protein VgrG
MRYEVTVDGADEVAWEVLGFRVREALSGEHRGEITLRCDAAPDPAAMPGKACTLLLRPGNEEPDRLFHGVVLGAAVEARGAAAFALRLEFGARMELARMGRDARIFQHKTLPDIVRAVLAGAGLPEDEQAWSLTSPHAEHEYVVQLGESDRDFVDRLLAEEGIAYAVRNGPDGATVAFFDGESGLEPIAGDTDLPHRIGAHTRSNTVDALRERRAVTSDAVMLRDYDFRRPSLDLSARDGGGAREVYRHPGNYRETDAGRRMATQLLEALRVGARRIEGVSDAPQLEPGRWFSIEGHPRAALNGDVLVTAVEHFGEVPTAGDGRATYRNRFEAIPRDVPFRPMAAPAAPVVGGVHVAFVTGPSGQELHGNASGQVRVRFPWDRSGLTDDRSSTWLRVGQLAMAGPMVIPRVGFEVLVDHELGDVDRPLVVGHLYNGTHRVPYELPGAAARSSIQTATTDGGGGANELRFDDTAGSEEIFLNASRDYTTDVENDSAVNVAADESASVGANQVVAVTAQHGEQVTGDRTLAVGGDQSTDAGGDLNDGTGGAESLSIGGSRRVTVGGDFVEATTGALDRTVGAMQVVTGVAGYARKVAGNSTTTVGGAWLELCAAGRSTACGGARVETVGALKMVKAKTIAVNCGAAYMMNCASEAVKCGGNRVDKAAAVAINAGGGLKVKATNVNITGESKVVLRVGGTVIEVTPAAVKIKSAKVDLTGVERLESTASHASN